MTPAPPHEQNTGDAENRDQLAQIDQGFHSEFSQRIGHGTEGADGRGIDNDADDLEEHFAHQIHAMGDLAARFAHLAERNASKNGNQKNL